MIKLAAYALVTADVYPDDGDRQFPKRWAVAPYLTTVKYPRRFIEFFTLTEMFNCKALSKKAIK